MTPAEAARQAGISWPSAHDAFAARADALPVGDLAPVAHLSIDEHRRGRARFAVDERAREYALLADRWHMLLRPGRPAGPAGPGEGRTADDAAYWLADATPAWRDAIQVVCLDLCSIYASVVHA